MLKKVTSYILALAGLTIIFSSCKKEYESIQSLDAKRITDYISRNNLTSMVEDSAKTGYYYQILTPGTGELLKNTDSVLYTGSAKGLENGTLYFSSGTTANLGTYVGYTGSLSYQGTPYAIPAIHDVLLKLRRGGSARILLPSHLAFGRNGSGEIPSNENIDLTITTYPEATQSALDDRLIQDFVASKGLNMTKDSSGVWYSISTIGDGDAFVTPNSIVTTAYAGRLTDGSVFDSSTNSSEFDFSTPPGEAALRAWIRIIPGKLKKGGKIRMIIPSRLGYGELGQGTIPGNAILDFDVEVLTITN